MSEAEAVNRAAHCPASISSPSKEYLYPAPGTKMDAFRRGLFVDGLGGFPGVYSSYVLRTIGNEGLLKLMENISDRTARFKSCVGACIGSHIIIANGECQGKIDFSQKGNGGFGFDPIFIPDGYDTTFAEMTLEEKNKVSHRGNSIRSFAEQFTNIFESD